MVYAPTIRRESAQKPTSNTIPPVIRAEAQARGWGLTGNFTQEGTLTFWHCHNGMMLAWARHISRYLSKKISL